MDLKQIKVEAKRKILDDKVNVWLLWLVVILLVSAVTYAVSNIPYIGWILSLFATPLSIGVYLIGKGILNGKPIDFMQLLEGYKDLNYAIYFVLLNIIVGLIVGVGMILLIVPGVYLALMYSQSLYIYIENKDKGVTIGEALKKSAEMMNGHKSELFVLWLTYLGHLLLGIITLGIWLIYAIPYIQLVSINYHNHLVNNQN
jgi:hypothetical protein